MTASLALAGGRSQEAPARAWPALGTAASSGATAAQLVALLKRGARAGPWDALPAAVVQLAETDGVAGVCIGPHATAAAQADAVSAYLEHRSVQRLALHCMPRNVLPAVALRASPAAAHIIALDISRLPGGLPVSAIPDALRAIFSCPNLQHAGVTLVDAAIAALPPHNMDHLPSLDQPAAPRPASAAPRRARPRAAPRRTARRASDAPASAAPEPVLHAFLQALGNAPSSLRSLSLAGSGMTSDSMKKLLLAEEPRAAHAWRQLHHLDLSGIQLRAEGVDALARALVELREFTAPAAGPGRSGSRPARARSPRPAEVGVKPAKSAQLAALQSLCLAGCGMQGQPGDADSLMRQLPEVSQLRRVDLRGNCLDDAAMSALCASLAGLQGPSSSGTTLPVLWPHQVQNSQSPVASNIEHLLAGVRLPSVPAGLWVLDVRDNAMTERGWHATIDALEACPALLYATGDGVSGSALWCQPRALLDRGVSQTAHRVHTLVAHAQAGEAAAKAAAREPKSSSRPGSRATSPARSRPAARSARAGAAKPAVAAAAAAAVASPPQPVPRPLTESVPAPRPPPQHHIDASSGQVPPHVAQRLARIAEQRWPAWCKRHALVVQAEQAAQSTALPVYIGCDVVPLAEQQGTAGPLLPCLAERSPVMQAALPAAPSTASMQWSSLGLIRQAALPAYCCGWSSEGTAYAQPAAAALPCNSWAAAAAAGDIPAEQSAATPELGRATLANIAGPPTTALGCPVLLWRSCAVVQGDLACRADEVQVDWRLCAVQDRERRVCAMGAWSRAHTTVQAALQAASQLAAAAAAAAQSRPDDAWVLAADADFPARATTPWSVATGGTARSDAGASEPAVYPVGWVALPLCHFAASSAPSPSATAPGGPGESDSNVAMSTQAALADAAVLDMQACATLRSGTASPCTVTVLVDSVCIVRPS